MKQLLVVVAVLGLFAVATQEASAQRGWHHHGNFGRVGGSGFSISIGNGLNGFSYSRGVPGFYATPIYRGAYGGFGGYGYAPVYRRPVYVSPRVYGGGFYGGGFYGRGGCGW